MAAIDAAAPSLRQKEQRQPNRRRVCRTSATSCRWTGLTANKRCQYAANDRCRSQSPRMRFKWVPRSCGCQLSIVVGSPVVGRHGDETIRDGEMKR
jgi:hypothetical protein